VVVPPRTSGRAVPTAVAGPTRREPSVSR
jgi:hypothetical protein